MKSDDEPWAERYKFPLVVPNKLMILIKHFASEQDRTITQQIIHYLWKGIEADGKSKPGQPLQ